MKKVYSRLFLLSLLFTYLFSCGSEETQDYTPEITPGEVVEHEAEEVEYRVEQQQLQDIELVAEPVVIEMDQDWMENSQRQRAVENGVLIQENIDTSVMTINYFDADEVDTSNLQMNSSAGDLEIIDFGPVGELPIESLRPSIYIQFDQPMVPLSKLGEVMERHPRISIEPEVEGVYRWYGTSLITFEPSNPLDRDELYQINVDRRIKSIYGKSLEEDLDFSFYLETIEIQGIYFHSNETPLRSNTNVPPSMLDKIYILFNQSIDVRHLSNFLDLKVEDRSISFRAREYQTSDGGSDASAHRMIVLEPDIDEIPRNSELRLILKAGASSQRNGPSRTNPQEEQIQTLHSFRYRTHSLRNLGIDEDENGSMNALYISFNQPLSEGALQFISTSFGEDYDIQANGDISRHVIRLNQLPVTYGDSYSFTIEEGLTDIYGQILETSLSHTVHVPNAGSYFSSPEGYHMLEAEYAPQIIYHFQNLEEGKLIFNGGRRVNFIDEQRPDEANYKLVDLTPWLNQFGYGQVRLVWDYTYYYYTSTGERHTRGGDRELNIQVTDIGISLRYGYNRVVLWANQLSSGEPIEGASVQLKALQNQGFVTDEVLTDENGIAVIDFEPGEFEELFYIPRHGFVLNAYVSTNEGDNANFSVSGIQSGDRFGISQSAPRWAENRSSRTIYFSDRGLYKPGEEVHIRGIDWTQEMREFSSYTGLYTVKLYEPGYRGEEVLTVVGNTSPSGGFYFTFSLPEDLEPGEYSIYYSRGNEEQFSRNKRIGIQIANFRRLNTQVDLIVADRPFYRGENITIPVEGSYLAGGAMASGELSYYVTRRSARFVPPGQEWSYWEWGASGYEAEKLVISSRDTLDSLGRFPIAISTDDWAVDGMPYRYIIEATVEDIDRQTVSSATSIFCHPAQWYLGGKLAGTVDGWWSHFFPLGESNTISVALVDPLGNLVEQALEYNLRIIRGEYKLVQQQGVSQRINTRYEWVEEEIEQRVLTLDGGLSDYRFTPEEPGRYNIILESQDAQGRPIKTDFSVYVTGGRWIRWASNNDEDINMIPDKDLYFSGDTARIMVQSPIPEGRYLMTIEGNGIIHEEVLELSSSTDIIEVPIEDSYVPICYVTLTTFRNRESLPQSYFEPDFGRPKGYFGAVQLNVSTASRELDIEILESNSVYRPGENAQVLIKVSHNGQPVANAEVIFLAVDRGVLDLIDYHVPNPLEFFYDREHFPLYVNGDDSRRLLLAPITYDVSNLIGGDGEESSKLDRREDFSPLAVFEPILVTNQDGIAVSQFQLPDTLTTYRTTAIALDGNRLGYEEDELMVQNPINVRTALPRRFRLRDTAFAGCVLHNLDSQAHEVTISVRSDILHIAGEEQKVIEIPPGGITEVPFVLEALRNGEGEIVFTVESEVLNEELVNPVIVERPLIAEAFTTIGRITSEDQSDHEEALLIPSRIAEGYGGMTVNMSSSMITFADRHIHVLRKARFSFIGDCVYKIIPEILFPDEDSRGTIIQYFYRMGSHQDSDGGIWSYYTSCRAAIALGFAKEEYPFDQYYIDEAMLLDHIENEMYSWGAFGKAMGLYTLALNGRTVSEEIVERIIGEEGDALGISGYGLIAQLYYLQGNHERSLELYNYMKNFCSAGTQSVHINENWEARDYYDSYYIQMSQLLILSILHGENAHWVMKLANGLNPDMHHSRRMSLQDHYWSIIALGHLRNTELQDNSDYRVEILLNGATLYQQEIMGIDERNLGGTWSFFESPMDSLERDSLNSLIFRREGVETLYFTSTIQYALPTEIAPARDEGISVLSIVETLDGEEVEDQLDLGETYRMRIILSTNRDRSFVRLHVPVPSGVDIVDPSFTTSSNFIPNEGLFQQGWVRNVGYDDDQRYIDDDYPDFYHWYFWWIRPDTFIYDNSIDYQWDSIYRGQREVSFLFRATTPGVYPTPPSSVYLEYEPEVFGRSDGVLYVIR